MIYHRTRAPTLGGIVVSWGEGFRSKGIMIEFEKKMSLDSPSDGLLEAERELHCAWVSTSQYCFPAEHSTFLG
jgi:hypothetical protein